MRLAGKVALVTGSTSGIGRATAEAFAREGADVVVSGRDERRGSEVVAAIRGDGGSARFLRADLAALESVKELAALGLNNGHGIDILVNNAGSGQETSSGSRAPTAPRRFYPPCSGARWPLARTRIRRSS